MRRSVVLLSILVVSVLLHQGSMERLLPYSPEVDEPVFVRPAIGIAATGDLDPRWFGHPGSTTIYPLAAAYYVAAHLPGADGGARLAAIAAGQQSLDASHYMVGRELSVLYSVGALVLTYLLGTALRDWRLGVAAMWVAAVIPLAVSYAQLVRSDSAATFFGMLSLLALHRAQTASGRGSVLLAGVSAGLAVASRYFMVALLPAFALGLLLSSMRPCDRGAPRANPLRQIAWLVGGAALAFAASTPYFFADWESVRTSLNAEAEVSHLGADGLSFFGNLGWYAWHSIPETFGLPAVAFAAVGLASLTRRSLLAWAGPLAFVAVFLVLISISPLHWHRWTIQALPVISLLVAAGLLWTARRVGDRWQWGLARRAAAVVMGLVIVTAMPLYQLISFELAERDGGVRYAARAWILANVPAGSRIVQEQYGAPLEGTPFSVEERFSLADDPFLEDYRLKGFDYLITSSAVDDRYLIDADKYRPELQFYRRVALELPLVWEGNAHEPVLPMAAGLIDDRCACNLWPVDGPPVIRVFALQQ